MVLVSRISHQRWTPVSLNENEPVKLKSGDWKRLQPIASALMVASGLAFTGLQWHTANQIADQSVYQRMVADWSDHLKTFIDKPHLWPYFEEGRPLGPDDQNRNLVLAVAEIRLQAMDAVLSNVRLRWSANSFMQWKTTFGRTFRQSPALCIRFAETLSEWEDELVAVANRSCVTKSSAPKP